MTDLQVYYFMLNLQMDGNFTCSSNTEILHLDLNIFWVCISDNENGRLSLNHIHICSSHKTILWLQKTHIELWCFCGAFMIFSCLCWCCFRAEAGRHVLYKNRHLQLHEDTSYILLCFTGKLIQRHQLMMTERWIIPAYSTANTKL